MTVREIKFRGRRVDNGEWVYGCLLINTRIGTCILEHGAGFGDPDFGNIMQDFYERKVHPDTVGQYTGRKDESPQKTEIYDGSRIMVTATRSKAWDDFEELKQPVEAFVFWEESMLCWFYEEKEYGEGGHPLGNCNCEVIGTIHDDSSSQ